MSLTIDMNNLTEINHALGNINKMRSHRNRAYTKAVLKLLLVKYPTHPATDTMRNLRNRVAAGKELERNLDALLTNVSLTEEDAKAVTHLMDAYAALKVPGGKFDLELMSNEKYLWDARHLIKGK